MIILKFVAGILFLISFLVAAFAVVEWGDLSSPKKVLNFHDEQRRKNYTNLAKVSYIVSILCWLVLFFICKIPHKHLPYFIPIETGALIMLFWLSYLRPGKKFEPPEK